MESVKVHNLGIEETYRDGQIIFKEGSPGDWIYIIRSGTVEISKNVGGETKIIELLQAGEVFGELGFIGGIKRTATAKAIGLTTLGIIDREFLDEEFNKLSGQFRAILVAITHRFKRCSIVRVIIAPELNLGFPRPYPWCSKTMNPLSVPILGILVSVHP